MKRKKKTILLRLTSIDGEKSAYRFQRTYPSFLNEANSLKLIPAQNIRLH